jgi:hypothetical protein
MLTLLVEICREFLSQQKRFHNKVIVFDWIAFGTAECETCLLIMYIFIGTSVWNLKLHMPEHKRGGRNFGVSLRHSGDTRWWSWWRHRERVEVEVHSFLTFATDGVRWLTSWPGCFISSKEPRYQVNRGGGGVGPDQDALEKIIACRCRDSNPRHGSLQPSCYTYAVRCRFHHNAMLIHVQNWM